MPAISFSVPSSLSVGTYVSISAEQVTASGERLWVDGLPIMMASDSGAFSISGQVLYTDIVGLSGVLNATGNTLYAIVTGLSGQAVSTYATITNLTLSGATLYGYVSSLSGVMTSLVANSGQQAWSAANNNGINLSGNAAATGAAIALSIAASGGQAWNAANNNAINLSGNATSSGAAIGANLAGLSGVHNADFRVFPKVTGNFTLTNSSFRYMWSGGATWTGTLPDPTVSSGLQYLVKNISLAAGAGNLFLTGLVDYSLNYTLLPTSAITLISDATSWIVV